MRYTSHHTTDEAEALEYIIALVYERSRIRLHDGKQSLIKARLGKRMRRLGLGSLPEYCDFLRRPGHEEEAVHALDALTTNFTNFLREEDHFRFMVEQALPALLDRGRRRFHIWSAACATGEEPYSIAFYLQEHFPLMAGWDWHILATDISTKALNHAAQGIYPEARLQTLPPRWVRKYFRRGLGAWAGYYQVKPQLAERVEFRQHNLLSSARFAEPFLVVFCRNVMIYFDRPTQEQLVQQLSRSLADHGFLLIGHSESLAGMPLKLRCLRPSIYQRI